MKYHSPIYTCMDSLEIIILSELSQSETYRYINPLICGILKDDTNELIYKTNKHADIKNKIIVSNRETLRGRVRDKLGGWNDHTLTAS